MCELVWWESEYCGLIYIQWILNFIGFLGYMGTMKFKCLTNYKCFEGMYAYFAKSMKLNTHEYASFSQSTNISTHKNKWTHSI